MIAEIGILSLIIALGFSLLLVFSPLIRRFSPCSPFFLVLGQMLFVSIAYISLTLCFLRDDFSVVYVYSNSSLALPWFYKLCAVWGGNEGSMLLWVVILCAWTFAVACFSKSLSAEMRSRVLVILGGLCAGFLVFLLATSNPFLRQFNLLNTQGNDLNPLLQDLGFLFHPPMLYMGYVGFAVPFAFAIAALWYGKMESAWTRWTRPWTLAAWCCLTVGITLGSWWAYRELGWGGYWFWDPVENASFMPWIAGTALIHSLIVSEKRQQFLAWTLFLAIVAFALSLIGTFLVRSGVLTSVHAFAVDPTRGSYILAFLFIVIAGSLLLFAIRAQSLRQQQHPALISRESFLLLNNVFLLAVLLTILLGTIYPLLIDALGLGKLSVGAPYFNRVFVLMMIPVCLLMGLGIHTKWQHDSLRRVALRLLAMMIVSLLLPVMMIYWFAESLKTDALFALILAIWIIITTLKFIYLKVKQQGVRKISRSAWGMALAHIGIAVTAIGIGVSSGYGVQQDVKMSPGEQEQFGKYRIQFLGETALQGPNYHGVQAKFVIQRDKVVKAIYPEKRIYNVGRMAMTDAAIDVTPFRDIYIALGEPLEDKAWSVRIYYKPLIRWIWGGGFLIFLGGVMAMSAVLYKRRT